MEITDFFPPILEFESEILFHEFLKTILQVYPVRLLLRLSRSRFLKPSYTR